MANSNLISNLNQIYATKLEIKELLNTESDDFTQYPNLIEAAIESGGATGYSYITENGNYNIATYEYAYVNVPQQEVPVVPPGYTYVSGTKEILTNGTVDISSYESAYVNVPAPEGWILPAGYAFVTNNGNFDIKEFEFVNVNVEGEIPPGYTYVSGTYSIVENGDGIDISSYAAVDVHVPVPAGYIIPAGTYNITDNGTFDVTTYASAYISVPSSAAVLGSLSAGENGVYTASSYGYDGFDSVSVQVPQSAHSGTSAVDAWTVDEAISYISAFEDTAEHVYTDLGFTPYVEGVIAAVRNTRSAQYPSARYTITRTGEAIAADYSNAIICWNINPAIGQQSWSEGVDRQVKVGDHVIIAADKLQKYYDSNNNVYQMEFKNGAEIQGQSEVANTLTISQPGTYDVQSYVSAYVDVQGGSSDTVELQGALWMNNYLIDSIGDYYKIDIEGITNLNNGLGSFTFGTYVNTDIIKYYSQQYLDKYGPYEGQKYKEDFDTSTLNAYTTVDSGSSYVWGYTNVTLPVSDYELEDYNGQHIVNKNDYSDKYIISAYDYNAWNSELSGKNILVNFSYIDEYNTKCASILGEAI